MTPVHASDAARDYIARGWRPIPWPKGQKGGPQSGWRELHVTAANVDQYFPRGRALNVGVLLGEPSGNLLDVDLDCVEALELAPRLLPGSGAVFGRQSKPSSHWLYVAAGVASLKFQLGGTTFVELRGTGLQTIFPGSVHPEGELVEWARAGEPSAVDAEQLEVSVRKLAAASLLVRNFPSKGTRDSLALAVHGLLASAKWEAVEAEEFVEIVFDAGGAVDVPAKVGKAARTKRRHDAGKPVAGFTMLEGIVGTHVAKAFVEWLNLRTQPTAEDVALAIHGLAPSSADSEVDRVIVEIARAKLSPLERDTAMTRLQRQTGRGIRLLRQALAAAESAPRSDEGPDQAMTLARELLSRHYSGGKHLVRDRARIFWEFVGTHWERVTEEQIQRRAIAIAEEMGARSVSALVRAAIDNLRGMQVRDGDPMRLSADPPPVVNCLNGELWLAPDGSFELKPHSPDSFLTYVLDVAFDPDADSPLFDQALEGIFQKAEDRPSLIAHVWEVIGYAIQPQRPIAAWLLLHGSGRNGKTKLVQTIERLLNRKAVTSLRISDLERDQFAIGELVGKLLLIDDDVDADTRLPDGLLKKISEQKSMTGQQKYAANFEFVARCFVVLLANNFPTAKDLSYGMRRRAQVIPFAHSFSEQDDDPALFPRIWATEMPGILNKAVHALQRLLQRSRFSEPIDVREARRVWLAAANPLVAFVTEGCRSRVDSRCELGRFYEAYQRRADENGVRVVQPKRSIGESLKGLGFELVDIRGKRTVKGLALRGDEVGDYGDDEL